MTRRSNEADEIKRSFWKIALRSIDYHSNGDSAIDSP